MYIYYKRKGKRIRIKEFNNVSDMFYWCEMNCDKVKGHYYLHGYLILCELQ